MIRVLLSALLGLQLRLSYLVTPRPEIWYRAPMKLMCVYPDDTIGYQGVRRTWKVGRAQQLALTRARMPCFQRRLRPCTVRQRWPLLCTGVVF
jgi:hypothetical protein